MPTTPHSFFGVVLATLAGFIARKGTDVAEFTYTVTVIQPRRTTS